MYALCSIHTFYIMMIGWLWLLVAANVMGLHSLELDNPYYTFIVQHTHTYTGYLPVIMLISCQLFVVWVRFNWNLFLSPVSLSLPFVFAFGNWNFIFVLNAIQFIEFKQISARALSPIAHKIHFILKFVRKQTHVRTHRHHAVFSSSNQAFYVTYVIYMQ